MVPLELVDSQALEDSRALGEPLRREEQAVDPPSRKWTKLIQLNRRRKRKLYEKDFVNV